MELTRDRSYVNITKRSDNLYNVWCLGMMTMPISELKNYSSRWVCIGVTETFNKGMVLANDFFVKEVK
jgi:hypothetical protein